ncbi:Anti-sigma regulatory factor (Ser/Thr protein kinase) [Streptomyces sp. DvalAA-14]|uniref:ATP-binding protein n=1 Tax=unclassified Streptomyces TaxID=2593676 RepID=UPI00081BB746|nr:MULTISPECIES: ATP-binding protein [unclassified Streptomyces]MYS22652.1 ATP-binding protein [Streptomyces sp. SID4948]SCE19916.1 Anti-sigma regulatory factor (Ser/Thr protein kinase) [Streptomyces sp. DvalAA-14]
MGTAVAVVIDTDPAAPPPVPYTPPQKLWPATARGVRLARHALADALAGWRLTELSDQASLVLSELMTNAQKYGRVQGRSIGASFTPVPGGILLEVHDARGEVRPALVTAGDSDEQGRGLFIVDAVTAGRWGTAPQPGGPGKVVWAVVHGPCAPPFPVHSD